MTQPTPHLNLVTELLIAWKWAAFIFGNVTSVILLLSWWNGNTWVQADAGALLDLSSRPGWQVKK